MQITTSWEERGIAKGIEQGIEQGMERGQRSLILLLLNQKVGTVPAHLSDRITALAPDQLEQLAIALLNFTTIADLEAWVTQQNNAP